MRWAADQLQVGDTDHCHGATVQRADCRTRPRLMRYDRGAQPMLAEQLRKHERCGLVERSPSRQAHHRSRTTPAWCELRLTWRHILGCWSHGKIVPDAPGCHDSKDVFAWRWILVLIFVQVLDQASDRLSNPFDP